MQAQVQHSGNRNWQPGEQVQWQLDATKCQNDVFINI